MAAEPYTVTARYVDEARSPECVEARRRDRHGDLQCAGRGGERVDARMIAYSATAIPRRKSACAALRGGAISRR